MIEIVNGFLLTLRRPNGSVEQHVLTDGACRPFPHTDPDLANEKCLNRIVEVPSWTEDLYADPARMAGSIGTGTLVLSNADQALSYWLGYSWERIEWRRGWEGLPWAQWAPVAVARPYPPGRTVSASAPSRLTVTLYDLRDDLASDVQTHAYLGTNVGDTGLEGEADAKGRLVPLAIGDLSIANIRPALVNQSKRIMQGHDGAIGGVLRLYDRGGPANFVSTGNVGSGIAGVSLTTAQMCTELVHGLWRLGGSTGGEVTADLVGAVGAGDTGPSLLKWLLNRRYAGAAALGPNFAAGAGTLLTTETAKMGLYLDSATAYRSVVDRICRSRMLWCIPDATGVWQLGQLGAPGAPVLTIDDNTVLRIEEDDASAAVPLGSVEVKWGRNYTPLARQSMASSVWDTPRELFLKEEWRVARDESATVKARWPNHRKFEIETELTEQAAAEQLVARLFAAFGLRADGTPRQSLRVAMEMTPERLAVPTGATVQLAYTPEGIDAPMVVMGRRIASPARHLMWMRVYG